jgi:hypothetical protein
MSLSGDDGRATPLLYPILRVSGNARTIARTQLGIYLQGALVRTRKLRPLRRELERTLDIGIAGSVCKSLQDGPKPTRPPSTPVGWQACDHVDLPEAHPVSG